jgi:hypothetical protein
VGVGVACWLAHARFQQARDFLLPRLSIFLPQPSCNHRCVVHYQLPASVDVYVHRSGRTARAEAEGISVALVTPKENARFLALLRAMNRDEPPEFPLVSRI